MKPFEDRRFASYLSVSAVITLHQQIRHALDRSGLHCRGWQAYGRGELHAERSIGNDALESLDSRLQDMRARRATQRKADVAAFDAHGNFVLRARKRKAYPLLFWRGQETPLSRSSS